MQRIYGFKPGDKIRFRGKKRWFRGKFESYATDNEAFDVKRSPATEVYAWFEADDDKHRYTVDPMELQHETDPEEL